MRRSSGFWWLAAIAVGVGGAFIPERLSGGSAAKTFVLMLVYTLAGALLISYINSTSAWRWAVAIVVGTLSAYIVLAIPASEPLTRDVVAHALFIQRANLAPLLAQTLAAMLGCMLGVSMSGGK